MNLSDINSLQLNDKLFKITLINKYNERNPCHI